MDGEDAAERQIELQIARTAQHIAPQIAIGSRRVDVKGRRVQILKLGSPACDIRIGSSNIVWALRAIAGVDSNQRSVFTGRYRKRCAAQYPKQRG